jgi:hypothetical protein
VKLDRKLKAIIRPMRKFAKKLFKKFLEEKHSDLDEHSSKDIYTLSRWDFYE